MTHPPLFLWKHGWRAPLGPYLPEQEEQLRRDGDQAARQYPGEVIHVLASVTTVQAPPPEPIWDGVLPQAEAAAP